MEIENKKMPRHIHKIDAVIIVITLVGLIFVFQYTQPLIIHPLEDVKTSNTSILFSFNNADKILIDDNLEFTSPEEIKVKDEIVINLVPGTYYWKVVGIFESEVRTLTILSEVGLKLKKLDCEECYGIVNAGNTRLKVDIYNETVLEDSIYLNIDEEKEATGDKFIGGPDEN